MTRILQTRLACIPLLAPQLYWTPEAPDWSAAGFMLSLARGIANAWVLLIENLGDTQ
jgi:hypothetical protein